MSDLNAIEDELGPETSQGDGVLQTIDQPDTTYWEEDENPESLMGDDLSDEEIRASFDEGDLDLSDEGELFELSDEELIAFLDDLDTEIRQASWHVAPSLVRLRAEINKKWPRRDKKSDGSIGDASHSARASDHNPNGRRSVNALDIDKDGISTATLIGALKKHPSVNYIIFNRVIYSRVRGFRGVRYSGANAHTLHVHVSIIQSRSAENSTRGWLSGVKVPVPKPPAPPKPRAKYALAAWPFADRTRYFAPYLKSKPPRYVSIERLQRKLHSLGYNLGAIDGQYGPTMYKAVLAFQRSNGLKADGLIGYKSWTKMRSK